MKIAPLGDFARSGPGLPQRCVVAIPMKDEAERAPACLRALAQQQDALGRPLPPGFFGVLLFANNCSDDSAAIASGLAPHLPYPLRIVAGRLPPSRAHAGGARRTAMDLADSWLGENNEPGGALLTTDADSRVPPRWIAANLAALQGGADAVLGRIALDEEGDALPPALLERGRLEGAYEALLTEVAALLDPLDHNPWPHHATISGASLGVARQVYRRVGGLPSVPLGEDKAFVAALLKQDARLRFAPGVEVVTSGRVNGRAPGGVADTLRLRSRDPGAFCDETLEPFRVAIKRARWRGRLRHLWRLGALDRSAAWSSGLGVSNDMARRIAQASTFGAAWSAIESESPVLARRLLAPADLPAQIAGAQRALGRLRKRPLIERERVEPEIAMAVPANDLGGPLEAGDEEFGGLVAG